MLVVYALHVVIRNAFLVPHFPTKKLVHIFLNTCIVYVL